MIIKFDMLCCWCGFEFKIDKDMSKKDLAENPVIVCKCKNCDGSFRNMFHFPKEHLDTM